MKRGHASIKSDLGDSHMTENCANPYPMDIRLERRWKRRDAITASATKTAAKISENKVVLTDKNDHMLEVEVDDVDYEEYLEKDVYASDMDSTSDNSGVLTDTSYNNDTHEIRDYKIHLVTHDSDTDTDYSETEEDYEIHLDGLVSDIEADETDADNDEMDGEYKEFFDKKGSGIEADKTDSDNDETDGNCKEYLDKYVSDIEADETDADNDEMDGEYKEYFNKKGSGIEADKTDSDNDETDGDSKEYLDEYVSDIDAESDLDEYVSGIEAHETDSDDDETDAESDYEYFLTPSRSVDGDSVQEGSNSSDSDIVLIEPNAICENTPFIYSKTYDSSWFDKEMNGRDGKHLSSDDRSQFRRRLMEYLQRPFDQQEYSLSLKAVNQRRQKERHIETRKGVIESYHAKGFNESYLESFPDLAKAIAEFDEPHKVLFVLRGFIFWLKNLCHEGIFRPWRDEMCLEVLRKI